MLAQLTIVDYIIALVIVGSTIISLIRGFVREALSLATWGSAVWVTFTFTDRLSDALIPYIDAQALRMGLSIVALFLVTLGIGITVSYFLTKFVNKSGLSGTDRIVGIAFGAGRGALIIAVGMIGIGLTPLAQSQAWQTSTFVPYFQPVANWFAQDFPQYLQHEGKKQLNASQEQANDKVDDALA